MHGENSDRGICAFVTHADLDILRESVAAVAAPDCSSAVEQCILEQCIWFYAIENDIDDIVLKLVYLAIVANDTADK